MTSLITIEELIDEFLRGETKGFSGTEKYQGSLFIDGERLIYQSEIIAERKNQRIVICKTSNSISAYRIKKLLVEKISSPAIIQA